MGTETEFPGRSSVMHFCILDRLDLFFVSPAIRFIFLAFVLCKDGVGVYCFSCMTTAASTSRYLSCMFICSYLVFIGTNYTYMCVAKHIGEVWIVSTYACSFSGVRIDFFISKHLDSALLTFACFYPSLIPHDLAWFTICTFELL